MIATQEQTTESEQHRAELIRAIEFIARHGLLGKVLTICPGDGFWRTQIHINDVAFEQLHWRCEATQSGEHMHYTTEREGFEVVACRKIEVL
jgi:hypothetical protein